jgi:hypothetical protein
MGWGYWKEHWNSKPWINPLSAGTPMLHAKSCGSMILQRLGKNLKILCPKRQRNSVDHVTLAYTENQLRCTVYVGLVTSLCFDAVIIYVTICLNKNILFFLSTESLELPHSFVRIVESLQSHCIPTQFYWSSSPPVCFPLWGIRVQHPLGGTYVKPGFSC